ncbi:NACHT domain-containing protein [Streptomyces sp. NPDC048441]|uniref:NACHT domain-containing protein n=1 Tax=Streptomyces sp. NPDC048441 TaxID=3365552 RepID=UPI00371D7682
MWGQIWVWLSAGALAVLGVLAAAITGVLKDAFTGGLKALPSRLLFACGGERRFLRRYADDLHARHHEMPIPFAVSSGPDVKISVASVYVPLRAAEGLSPRGPAGAEALGWEEVDALLAEGSTVVVCGDPGAGKSMYLRRAVLAWAEARRADAAVRDGRDGRGGRARRRSGQRASRRAERVPVLLELHKLKPGALDVVDLLTQHLAGLAGPGVPRRWIEKRLLAGRVTLYLDGLDEVSAAARHDVVHWIKDVAQQYHRSGMLVTCRTAAYAGHREHLKEAVDRSLAIQEFTDLHIHQFLRGWPWPERTAPDSVERLLRALAEAPRLMSLARNPLLLTAIAYLYSYVYPDTDKELPRTRAEFYQQVSDAFVDDRGRQADFGTDLKRAVLCHAGLKAQDALAESAGHRDADGGVGREFSAGVLLEWVAEVLERQHEEQNKAQSVIDEIYVRSGLLSKIENGRYYQFAHISLQEYLAAEALADDWPALLARYDTDAERWRETVRLWCGVTRRDCSPMIRHLRARDELLSFQCLAEARYVDDDLIQEMVRDAGERLGSGGGSERGRALEAALGVAATGPASRADAVFALLGPLAADPATPDAVRCAAIRALAATASHRAACLLAPLLDHHLPRNHHATAASDGLASMGDIAVPALREAALGGSGPAVDALGTVGTGRAAVALAQVMYETEAVDERLRRQCAVKLGGLVEEREVQEALREWTAPEIESRDLHDAWSPFAERPDDALTSVMGRVARLVGSAFAAGELPASARLDARLVAALLLLDGSGVDGALTASSSGTEAQVREWARRLRRPDFTFYDDDSPLHFVREVIDHAIAPFAHLAEEEQNDLYDLCRRVLTPPGGEAEDLLHMIDKLPVRERLLALGFRWLGRRVDPQQWATCVDPPQDVDYDFDASWHYRLLFGLLIAVSAVAGVRAVLAASTVDRWGPPWLGWAAVGAIIGGWIALWLGEAFDEPDELILATVPFFTSYGYGTPSDGEDWRQLVSGLVFGPAAAVYAFVGWSDWWGTGAAIAVSVAVVAVGSAAVLRGLVRGRRARRGADKTRRVAHEVVTELRRRAGTGTVTA